MLLPTPASLADLRADGALLQSDIDVIWEAWLGPVDGVEFSGDAVRIHTRSGPRDLPATEVARVIDGAWIWNQPSDLDIPDLQGPLPASDELLRAARTLHGNVPFLLAPVAGGHRVMAVHHVPSPGPVRSALTLGLATFPEDLDARRSVLAFAAARGVGVRTRDDLIELADGTSVLCDGPRPVAVHGGLSHTDVLADALYLSAEHQLLWEGKFPRAEVRLDIPSGRALINGTVPADAVIVATITGDTWTWGWADPHLPPSAAANLRRFGIDHGILDLVRPSLPVRPDLIDLCKPVLDMWTHTSVPLTGQTRAVVLLSAPELALPEPGSPLTPRAVETTLGKVVPAGVDKQRAREVYARRRGITLPAE